jgi:hypothetical protein
MTFTWCAATLVLLLPLAAACHKAVARLETPHVDRSCQIVVAVPAAGDTDFAKRQDDVRYRRLTLHAAEHLGYPHPGSARSHWRRRCPRASSARLDSGLKGLLNGLERPRRHAERELQVHGLGWLTGSEGSERAFKRRRDRRSDGLNLADDLVHGS